MSHGQTRLGNLRVVVDTVCVRNTPSMADLRHKVAVLHNILLCVNSNRVCDVNLRPYLF